MHHLMGTGLRCAPPTCDVHHSAQGGPMSVRRAQIPDSNCTIYFEWPCSVLVFDNKHANHGSQCRSVPTYTLVVHNIALY